MAGEFAHDNGARLEKRLGRAVGATDLYMAHFLGAGGAVTFLGALAAAPATAAAAILPAAAAANRAVFYHRDGSARTVAEVYDRFAVKLGGVHTPLPARQGPSRTSPARGEVSVDNSRARLAYMLLAELGG